MIQLKITGVSRRSSSEVNTVRFTYPEGKERTHERFNGAVWEEVEFQLVEEDKPLYRVANIEGSGYLVGNVARILINDPALFGTFKVGDIIDFIPKVIVAEPPAPPAPAPQALPPVSASPLGAPAPEAAKPTETTLVGNVAVPNLT